MKEPGSAINVLGLDNVLLAADDIGAARRFYTELLGLPLKFEADAAGIAGFAIGDEEPGIFVRVGEPQAPRFWLEVPDARRAAEQLRARGLEPLAPPFEVFTGWAVEYSDPSGNVVGLTDYVKAPERARPAAHPPNAPSPRTAGGGQEGVWSRAPTLKQPLVQPER